MPINKESLNRRLYKVLGRYSPKALDFNGEVTPIEDDADVFKFEFTKDGEDYGTVYATIDDANTLTIWYNNDVMDSPGSPTPGLDYNDTFTGLTVMLKKWAMNNQLSFKREDGNRLGGEMARRKHMKEKENISEGYYPMGKKASYSDAVPNVKIILQHSKMMQEGEQRFRHIEKIFVENASGERFLVPTTKPGLARVFARHIAEGGTPYDERAGHIQSLVEEYNKMAGFVRATRNGQFNESAQQLVQEGINHYQSLRECLSKLTGRKGYTAYFESWTPSLMEDEIDTTALNELFVQETLDPRIESVMPILSKLHKTVAEMREVSDLSEWADSLTEDESLTSNNPQGIPENAVVDAPAMSKEEYLSKRKALQDMQMDPEISRDPVAKKQVIVRLAKLRKQAEAAGLLDEGMLDGSGEIDSPVANAITRRILMQRTDLLAKHGPEKVADAIAAIAGDLDGWIGPDDEIGSSDVSAWVKRVEQELGGSQLEESHMSEADMILQDIISGELDAYDVMNHPKTPEEEYVAHILNDKYEEVARENRLHPDDDFEEILNIVVDQLADEYGHPEEVEEGLGGAVAGGIAGATLTKTPGGAMTGAEIGSTLQDKLTQEGILDTVKKVGGKVLDKLGHGSDEELLRDLKKKAGVRNPQNAKPSMAYSDVEKVEEDLGPEQKRVGQLGPTEKIGKKGTVGKLVGANESFINTDAQAVVTEMDSEGYKGTRDDGDSKGPEGKAKPIKGKDFTKAAEKELNKEMDKAHKKDVKEGQEDLDAILRIVKK